MNRFPLLVLALGLVGAPLAAQQPALIPKPREVQVGAGSFTLADTITIALALDTPRLGEIGGVLRAVLGEVGVASRMTIADSAPGGVVLRSRGPLDDESYRLTIDSSGIIIEAPSDIGVLWGVQTLRQLVLASNDRTIPAYTINDWPEYRWRGAMLDVGRHLFPVEYILAHLEWMSRYKLNVFHWHLTEDQGWRIAIDALPRLTSVGAWRDDPAALALNHDAMPTRDGRYGGFYSKADVRRVVERARILGITVVPEIEIPGHSRAAIAAYPHLGCTGEVLPVPSTWGVFTDVLCPTEATFEFLETVLAEVLELFPSRFIHIGGDEVPPARWRECDQCQEIIARERLGDEHGLQSWMLERVGGWLAERGRRMIGWDEILDGGLPADAVVQAWQGSDRITAAIAAGADVIASPNEFVYLNTPQDRLPLDRVLQFDPGAFVGPGEGRLLGAEAPLWTEHVTSAPNAELMWWPRLLAFADIVWLGSSAPPDFARRAAVATATMQRAGVAIGPTDAALFNLGFAFDSRAARLRVRFTSPLDDLVLRLINTSGIAMAIADGALLPAEGEWQLSAATGGSPVGEPRRLRLTQHLALGKPVTFATPPDPRYPGTGGQTLVDGARGATFADGFWNGWWGPDLDVTIDLGRAQPVGSVSISLLEQVNSWITYPGSVEVLVATGEGDWQQIERRELDRVVVPDASSRREVVFTLPDATRARWVRLVARNGGALPPWHSGAGQPSWIFADEIVVRP